MPVKLNPVTTAAVAMILSAAAWGLGTVMSKAIIDVIPPVSLLVIQLSASVIALWLVTGIARIRFHPAALKRGWTGIFEPGIAYLLGLIGVQMTTASHATLISALEPLLILCLALLFLGERISRLTVLLMLISVFGVLLVTLTPTESGQTSLGGDLMVLFGTLSAAIYVILSRHSVAHLHPLPLAAAQQTVGLLVALVALGIMGTMSAPSATINLTWPLVGFAALSGIVQYSIAFALYLTALRTIPATQAALYLTLIPVFGITGAVLFLGEMLSGAQIVGALLIIGALFCFNAYHAYTT